MPPQYTTMTEDEYNQYHSSTQHTSTSALKQYTRNLLVYFRILPTMDDQQGLLNEDDKQADRKWKKPKWLKPLLLIIAGIFIFIWSISGVFRNQSRRHISLDQGWTDQPSIFHNLGQYSPWFSIADKETGDPPLHKVCSITMAISLQRHGSRYPVSSQTAPLMDIVDKLSQSKTDNDTYSWIKDLKYDLESDKLVKMGQHELHDAGIRFAKRYRDLVDIRNPPFVRSTDQARMVDSAEHWIEGFNSEFSNDDLIEGFLQIPEQSNNTLSSYGCPAAKNPPYSNLGGDARAIYRDIFAPPIAERLSKAINTSLTTTDITSMMALCAFETVAHDGEISDFCGLFAVDEWESYNYYLSLEKFYGFGYGNPLGPSRGIGYVNELIARFRNDDPKLGYGINETLDLTPDTFPLSRSLYADFSHDNTMVGIFSALGLFRNTSSFDPEGGNLRFNVSEIVPFGSTAYFEKVECKDGFFTNSVFPYVHTTYKTFIRIFVNNVLQNLDACHYEPEFGLCEFDSFVENSIVTKGDNFNLCFVAENTTSSTTNMGFNQTTQTADNDDDDDESLESSYE